LIGGRELVKGLVYLVNLVEWFYFGLTVAHVL